MSMSTVLKVAALLVVSVLICSMAPIGYSDVSEYVIVANKDVAGSTIGMASLKGIYLREVRTWQGGGEIIPVDLSTGGSFYQDLFGKTYVQMQAYWLSMRIKYSVNLPVSKKDAESVLKFVAENKGSIGFLKNGAADDRVKVLKVN
jgi:hypothetical protein